jgi:hypothetical protein
MKRRVITSILAATAIIIPLTAATNAKATTPTWTPVWTTTFQQNASKGQFSGCTNGAPYTCSGLPSDVAWQWWAYPAGWQDTAASGQLGTYKVGGLYEPQQTVSIANGMMTINEYNSGGYNHVAAVIPKAAINKMYGKYTETLRVTAAPTGYKSAHLLWPDAADTTAAQKSGIEIDFPEGDWDDNPAYGGDAYNYDHPNNGGSQLSFDSNVKWSAWHTYTIKWMPGSITTYVDNNVVGTSSDAAYVPSVNMDWIIQNESSLDGESSVPGPHAQMQIKYVEYDKYTG